jgi:hypothetical protein
MKSPQVFELVFNGPYSFNDECGDTIFKENDILTAQGIYLWTVPIAGGYKPYYIGETGVSFLERLRTHAKEYLSGEYRIYESEAFVSGNKKLIWQGMWLPGTRDKMPEFIKAYTGLAPKIIDFISLFRLFLAPIICETRTRKLIEGGIARFLYDFQENDGKILIEKEDRNRFCRRKSSEASVTIRISDTRRIAGLPNELIL